MNGKIALDKKPKRVDAPSPSQIAERAYILAIGSALVAVGLNPGLTAEQVRQHMTQTMPVDLAALRESVINPGVLPWWRKPE